jgi:hypothetical protein
MADIGVLTPDQMRRVLALVARFEQSRDGKPDDTILEPPGIPVLNRSGQTVPAFAFMQMYATVEAAEQNYIEIKKPINSAILRCPFLINGPVEIENNGFGRAQAGPIFRVYCSDAMTLGDRIGPADDEWYGGLGSMYAVIGTDDIAPDVYKCMFDTSSWLGRTKVGGLSIGTPALVQVYDANGTIRATEYLAETHVSNIAQSTDVLLLSYYGRWLALGLC